MGLILDIHLHTKRYSVCSTLDEHLLVAQAVKKGLDGVVITEHHHQWTDGELAELANESGHLGFLLLTGFEYTASQGDVLIYGLQPEQVSAFQPFGEVRDVLDRVHDMGGVCVAAHPTRAGLGFDVRIRDLSFDALEVQSVNLEPHEQRLAHRLAKDLGIPGLAASDAHRLDDVGAYTTVFDAAIRNVADLLHAIRHREFRIYENLA